MPGVLLYDRDCGFCTATAARLSRLGCRLPMVPWQDWVPLAAHGITREAAASVVHVVDGDEVLTGHRAVARALQLTRSRSVRALGRALDSRLLRRPAAAGYAWVAAHRHSLPGGTRDCRIEAR